MGAKRKQISIAHVLFRFAIGGLENGVVNLINRLPEDSYHHHIICLTDYDEDFYQRIKTKNVDIHCLHKQQGKDLKVWLRLYKLLKKLRPNVLHSRNFSAIESHTPAVLAGVKLRIHGEHGWDMNDLHGSNNKYRIARRIFSYIIHDFIALSKDLEDYLRDRVGVAERKINQIYNGVESERFSPPATSSNLDPSNGSDVITIGTVGRMKAVKNQTLLTQAFIELNNKRPELKGNLRLRLIGDGPLRAECLTLLQQAGLEQQADLPGDRNDVPVQMQQMDIFVLPSLAEGISNTILEAMACGLPVIATRVGGNAELVEHDKSGLIVESENLSQMVEALEQYIDQPELRLEHGQRGRSLIEQQYSMEKMVNAYDSIYRKVLER